MLVQTFTPFSARVLLLCLTALLSGKELWSQNCFGIDVGSSKIQLSPGQNLNFPKSGDTISIPCTKKIENFFIVLKFNNGTETYFEDSTQLVATLLNNNFTYVLKYDKSTNTFQLPTNATDLDIGYYSLTVSSSGCSPAGVVCGNCIPTHAFSVTFIGNVNLNISIDTDPQPPVLTCFPGSKVILTATKSPNNNFTAQWAQLISGQFENIAGATTNTLTTDQAGVFRYTLSGPANCKAAEIVTVNPPQKPAVLLNPDTQLLVVCEQTITGIMLNNTGSNGVTYNWAADATGVIKSGANTPNPVVSAIGNYTLTVTRQDNGCTASTVLTVAPGTLPTVSVSIGKNPDRTQLDCTVDAIKLDAVAGLSSGSSGFTYLWSNGISGSSIVVTAPGTYSVTATAAVSGCQGSNAVIMTEDLSLPNFTITSSRDTLCAGESATLTVVLQTPVTFQWHDGSINNMVNVSPAADGPNTYSVTITSNTSGCTVVGTRTVVRVPVPAIACPYDVKTISDGEQPTVDCLASDGTLIWSAVAVNVLNFPPSGKGPIQQVYSLADPKAPGQVLLTLYAQNPGCTSADVELIVQVAPVSGSDGIFIPDLITPNGDGQNDSWRIVIPDAIANPESYRLTVFNRLGAEVFSGHLLENFPAEKHPDGTYYYLIQKPDGQKISGAVTILRRQAP